MPRKGGRQPNKAKVGSDQHFKDLISQASGAQLLDLISYAILLLVDWDDTKRKLPPDVDAGDWPLEAVQLIVRSLSRTRASRLAELFANDRKRSRSFLQQLEARLITLPGSLPNQLLHNYCDMRDALAAQPQRKQRGPDPVVTAKIEKALRLRAQGLTDQAVAKEVGYKNKESLQRAIQRYRVRSRGQTPKRQI